MGLRFSASSLEECLEKAADELNISKDLLKYEVTKEEKKFFKKIVEIEILEEETKIEENGEKSESEEIYEQKNTDEIIKEDIVKNCGGKVENGKIIITDFTENSDIITIKNCDGIKLLINGEECNYITPVKEEDKIEYSFIEDEAIREVHINITTDKMEAYISINYVPQNIYELVDQEYCKNLILKKKKVGEKYPPLYSTMELKDILKSKGVSYGILEEELEDISKEQKVTNRLVAKGIEAENDIPDRIELYFEDLDRLANHSEEEKIDYRKRYLIANAKVNDTIAEKIPGKEGKDGIDVLGKPVKRIAAKPLIIKAGTGCNIKNNKVIATTEGKPVQKGNTFMVNKLYRVDEVNLQTGNVEFVGDVEVAGTVDEGMEVNAGNEVFVGKNVETAKISAGGQIKINGNVIKSNVKAGGDNVKRRQYLETLQKYYENIKEIISSTKKLKSSNMLGPKSDGEIVKILIENKFKSLTKESKFILNYNVSQGMQETQITTFIIDKLIGFGPLKIKDISELSEFEEIIGEEIEEVEALVILPSNIELSYSQASTIEASGDIIITGKGQYTSEMTALNNIEFTTPGAVCRGGTLSAGGEIKLKTVGSVAGVNTVIKVPKAGRITADVAYNNTVFCFGEKQRILEVSSKEVVAYLDKTGDVVIDKFVL